MTVSGTFVVESSTSDKFAVGDSYALTFAEGPIFVSSVSLLSPTPAEDIPAIPADESPTTFEPPTTVSEAQPPVGFVPSSPTEPVLTGDSTAPSDTPAS